MSDISHNPHDKLVGNLLKDSEMAAALLKNHLPAEALAKLDLSTLKPSSEIVVTQEWKKLYNDLVFRCKTKDKEDTQIYLLIEHQSTPDLSMPIRLLRYKLHVVDQYINSKEKTPNVLSLVLYHGAEKYPYKMDIFSCFEDPELAYKDIVEPMLLLDLANTPEDVILRQGGKDALLKLLLKYSREKDFVQKVQSLMDSNREIFVSLSLPQAKFMFEYVLHVGKGTPKNAEAMKEAINQIYGEAQAEKIFSLADFFKLEGVKEGIKEGEEKGKLEGKLDIAKQMLAKGEPTEKIKEYTGLSIKEIQELASIP